MKLLMQQAFIKMRHQCIVEIKQITGYKDSKIKITLHRARKSFQKEFEKIYGKELIMNS